jgi:hypothetical protein
MGFQPMLNSFHSQFAFLTQVTELEAQRLAFHLNIVCSSKVSRPRKRRAWILELVRDLEKWKMLAWAGSPCHGRVAGS